jgi:hypothetical protein
MKQIKIKSLTITIDFGALLLSFIEILAFLFSLSISIMNFSRGNIALGIAWVILTGVWGYDVYADWRQFEPLTFKK